MSIDYTQNTFKYYLDKETSEIKELPSKTQSKLLANLNKKIDETIEKLKLFLINKNIDSLEAYKANLTKIQEFITSLVNEQIDSIQILFKELEGL